MVQDLHSLNLKPREVKRMADLIETPYELRKQLGSHLKQIKRLDPWKLERKRTDQLKKKLIRDFGGECAICGINNDVVAAHIIPLEIGAETTEENLVLLCLKCHGSYDKRYVSINVMKKLAEKWRKGEFIEFSWPPIQSTKQPTSAMIAPPKSVQAIMEKVRELQYMKKQYCKAIGIIENAFKDGNLDSEGRLYLLIKRGELSRRRAARKVVVDASKLLEKINLKELPLRYHPVYYYELTYAYTLRGYHSKAAQIIRLSAEASEKREQGGIPSLEYISALAIEIFCLHAARKTLSPQEVQDFVARLHELELIAKQHGEYWGGALDSKLCRS